MTAFSKTPLRISFFGGGSDYEEYFTDNECAVLGSSINKYVYIFELPMSTFSPKKFKLSYRTIEEVDNPSEFKHPVVSSVLKRMKWKKPINISTMSDLPGGTGLGSSSSFTVGLINLLQHIDKKKISQLSLATEAYKIEHDILKENVGLQDHLHASFGGLNLYRIIGKKITIEPLQISNKFKTLLNESVIMVYTGTVRHASKVLKEQLKNLHNQMNTCYIRDSVNLAIEAAEKFQNTKNEKKLLIEFGKLLQESWKLKKSFSKKITTNEVDRIYQKGIELGAYGGKLCGAGGGGFIMFLIDNSLKEKFSKTFGATRVLDIRFVDEGSFIRDISN